MTRTEIENHVLEALGRIGPATVAAIKRSLTMNTGATLLFGDVGRAVLRLQAAGLLAQTDEEYVGVDVHPVFSLTEGGKAAARWAKEINRSREAARKKEVADD